MHPSNNKQRRQRQDIAEIIGILADRFPAAFTRQRHRRTLLKLGIRVDIAAVLPINDRMLGQALHWYTNSLTYLHRQKVGAPRVDLDGNECGSVTEDEAAAARRRIDEKYKDERKRLRKLEKQRKAQAKIQAKPQRLGLTELREAARRRKAQNVLQV
jgi:ProP effector